MWRCDTTHTRNAVNKLAGSAVIFKPTGEACGLDQPGIGGAIFFSFDQCQSPRDPSTMSGPASSRRRMPRPANSVGYSCRRRCSWVIVKLDLFRQACSNITVYQRKLVCLVMEPLARLPNNRNHLIPASVFVWNIINGFANAKSNSLLKLWALFWTRTVEQSSPALALKELRQQE